MSWHQEEDQNLLLATQLHIQKLQNEAQQFDQLLQIRKMEKKVSLQELFEKMKIESQLKAEHQDLEQTEEQRKDLEQQHQKTMYMMSTID